MEILKLNPFNQGDTLGGIYKYQNHLIKLYVENGMLKPPPLELNDRPSQLFIKGLIGDIIEELVEANAHYRQNILEFHIENGHKFIKGSPAFSSEAWSQVHQALVDYSEELADLTHFFIELLIYSNIEPEDVLIFINKSGLNTHVRPLEGSFQNASMTMSYNRDISTIKFNSFRFYSITDQKDFRNDYPGVFISPDMYNLMEVLSYRLIESLKLASYKLKNKYWKKQDVETSALDYQQQVMEAWQKMFDYMVAVGMSERRFYSAYEQKNIKNQNRLKDGY